jgi:energy-coupling factor transport system ATP-binding protein
VDYEEVRGVGPLSLQIPAGQFVLVTGPSGCGKSTLARALAGLIPLAIAAHMGGQVWVDGVDTRGAAASGGRPLPELARHVGMVLQNPSTQLFHLTVAEEVAFGPLNLGLAEEAVQARVAWALAATGLQGFDLRRPADLSGGEQQRVAIAAVLAMRPRVLVLDEPTASLDSSGTRMVLETLRGLSEAGMTIVLVEHRLRMALPLAQRVVRMAEGKIVEDESGAMDDRRWTIDDGRAFSTGRRSRATEAGRPLLQLQNVSAGYRGRAVVQNVDLALSAGEFAAIVGENGSGKSTLARVMAGFLRPMTGRVHFYRRGPREVQRRPRPGHDVALLFQNPLEQLFTDMVDDEIGFGSQNFGAFDDEFHEELLRQADLHGQRHRCPTRLSVGQQQRCVLAACLALRPQLLILDEPTLGQDWAHLQQLMDFVQLMNEQGTTVLLISHDLDLVARYARRVVRLEGGRICENVETAERVAALAAPWEGV